MEYPAISDILRMERILAPQRKISMVLDTDTYNEIDDQFALVYSLLSRRSLDVKAIYAAPFVNSRSSCPVEGMDRSYQEILTLLEKLDMNGSAPPVFKGSDRWMSADQRPVKSEAASHLVELAMNQPDGELLYVVAIAAITNIASAIRLQPAILNKIVVVWLGGHPHNHPHTDEFNLKQDPVASSIILDCGVPLVMMPCANVAEHLLLTREDVINRIDYSHPLGEYLAKEFLKYADETGSDSRPIWDMTPIAWLVQSEWVQTSLIHAPAIAIRQDASRNCVWAIDTNRHLIREAYHINRDAIFKDFFTKLNAMKV